MRIAVLSDIHANRHALEAVTKDATASNVEEFWCLGDVVGYGAHPREALQWAESHCRFVVRGNHDHAVATGDLAWFNETAAAAARFHAQLLDPDERGRVYGWPLEVRHEVGGVPVLLVHASPDDPLREYVLPGDAPRSLRRWQGHARIILLGHTHVPFAATLEAPGSANAAGDEAPWTTLGFAEQPTAREDDGPPLLLVNPGSVGQPRDLDPRASYAILDFAARTVELRRVSYDVEAAGQAITRAGLPTMLALRLYRGR